MKPAPAALAIGKGRDRGVGEHVDADRLAELAADAVGDDRHVGRCLRSDVVRLGEGHVAMILDDHAVAAAIEIGARIVEAALIDRLDRLAVIARRAGKRREVDDADDHLGAAEELDERVAARLTDRTWRAAVMRAPFASMSAAISAARRAG